MAAPRSIKSYVYPCDNDIASLLDSAFVQGALRKIANRRYSKQIQDAVNGGVILSRNSFPSVFDVIDNCAKKIVIPKDFTLVLTSKLRGANSLAIESNGKGVIFLSHLAITMLNKEELSFMLGHEFGHIAQGNLSCHTVKGMIDNLKESSELLGGFLSDMISVPLNRWYQCSEFTEDRAGFLCCGSVDSALGLLRKVQPAREGLINGFFELGSAHPFLHHREQELRRYANEINES